MPRMQVQNDLDQYLVTVENPGYRISFIHFAHDGNAPSTLSISMSLMLLGCNNSVARKLQRALRSATVLSTREIDHDLMFAEGLSVKVKTLKTVEVRIVEQAEDPGYGT